MSTIGSIIRFTTLAIGCQFGFAAGTVTNLAAQEIGGPVQIDFPNNAHAETAAYWTAERMASAVPPPPVAPVAASGIPVSKNRSPLSTGSMKILPGWNPASGLPAPTLNDIVEVRLGSQIDSSDSQTDNNQPTNVGDIPANPLEYQKYPPFQRHTWFGRYLTFPTSVHGKLFARLNGSDITCSAAVTQKNAILTAGNCVGGGNSTTATNILFCPSYNAINGVNPAVGCWSAASVFMPNGWFANRDIDRDFACIVTSTSGTVHANSIGNITGFAGSGFGNLLRNELIYSFGYPTAAPFAGNRIMMSTSVVSYSIDNGFDSRPSRYIGSDMTDGAQGGAWLISMRHNSAEIRPVDDDFLYTNPNKINAASGPLIVGINSHRRCMGFPCSIPPTASTGMFWNEWASADFEDLAGQNDTPFDVTIDCLNNGGM